MNIPLEPAAFTDTGRDVALCFHNGLDRDPELSTPEGVNENKLGTSQKKILELKQALYLKRITGPLQVCLQRGSFSVVSAISILQMIFTKCY